MPPGNCQYGVSSLQSISGCLAAIEFERPVDAIYEIGGADQVTYADVMREYARQRGLRRRVVRVPVITPRASRVLLGLLTSGSMLLCIWYAEMFERLSGPGIKAWTGVQRFHPDDALFLLAPLTWLNWLAPILVASSICTPIIAIVFVARYVALKRRTTAA